jgi:transcriptional regulator GlxA family with amidase domain
VPRENGVQVAIPLYEGFTALDAIGPFEVLSRMRGAEVTLVGEKRGPVRTENGRAALYVDVELEQLAEPEIVCVPGGFGSRALLDDERLLGWIRHAHRHSDWTTSVCTGSLLLAAAGVLDGVPATTHWLAMDLLEELGARPVGERVVEQGKVITAAGVSAGIDMALILVAKVAGEKAAQAVQLSIEYDPRPPFDAGSPRTAPAEIVERMRAGARERSAG